MNEHRKEMFIRKIFEKLYHTLLGKRICIFGFAFKKNTKDTRYNNYYRLIIISYIIYIYKLIFPFYYKN